MSHEEDVTTLSQRLDQLFAGQCLRRRRSRHQEQRENSRQSHGTLHFGTSTRQSTVCAPIGELSIHGCAGAKI
jgi:hypothetical protein